MWTAEHAYRTSPAMIDLAMPRSAGSASLAREVLLVLAGTALVGLCAQVAIPLQPVPVTLQTFAVVLVGALYGARRGGLTLLVYLLEGAVGLPVFSAGGAGIGRLMGPTAGYLWTFPLAAFVVGGLAEMGCDRRLSRVIPMILAGNVLILAGGFAWLAAFAGPGAAWSVGVKPFLLIDVFKITLTVAALPPGRRWLERVRQDDSTSTDG
jgi:biotin transport system substrate-specific component